jgi:hypothetical protein
MNSEENNNLNSQQGQPVPPTQPAPQPIQQVAPQMQQATQFEQQVQTFPQNQAFQNVPQFGSSKPKFKLRLPHIPKKVAILGGAVVVLAVAAVIVLPMIFKGDEKVEYAKEYFDENKPIKIAEKGLYGFINTKGEKIVEPKYSSVGTYYGDYAVVTKTSSENESKRMVINKKGEVILTSESSYGTFEYIADSGVWLLDRRLYNKSMKPITSETVKVSSIGSGYFEYSDEVDGTTGIMTGTGKKTYTDANNGLFDYVSIDASTVSAPELKDVYCKINRDNKTYGIVNCANGKMVYDFTTDYISVQSNNVFKIQDEVFDLDGDYEYVYIEGNKVAYTVQKGEISYEGNSILRINDSDDETKYYNIKDKKILEERPSTEDLLVGLKAVKCPNGRYGIKDGDKEITGCNWDDVNSFGDPFYTYAKSKGKELLIVRKENKTMIYDVKKGETTATFDTSYISGGTGGSSIFVYYTESDGKNKVVYDVLTDKSQKFDKDAYISTYSNYFTVTEKNKINYYNTDFEMIYSTKED